MILSDLNGAIIEVLTDREQLFLGGGGCVTLIAYIGTTHTEWELKRKARSLS